MSFIAWSTTLLLQYPDVHCLYLNAGVITAEDGSLYLPAVATQAHMIQCLQSQPPAVIKRAKDGVCSMGNRGVHLWELHNAVVRLGGYEKVLDR